MMWTKNDLSELLRNGKLEVSFIKKDGTGRVMMCSLEEKYVLAVWDIDNNGWRSFRINSIVSVKVIND